MKEKYHLNKDAAKRFAALTISTVIAGSMIIPAAAVPEVEEENNTYYFLAPDDWCSADVGAYWWGSNDNPTWPGVVMEQATEIGENVYKIENVPSDATTIIFNNYGNDGQTVDISLNGYGDDGICPYNELLETDGFDNWIYVLDMDSVQNSCETTMFSGAWFDLNDYENYDEYYGTYAFGQDGTPDEAKMHEYYFLAPPEFFNNEEEKIGAYWWGTNDNTVWPGVVMEAAPYIGNNVYKVEVTSIAPCIIFNNYGNGCQTIDVSLRLYHELRRFARAV